MTVGPFGLLRERGRLDEALSDPSQHGLDRSFIALLIVTSISGLLLLALRNSSLMIVLLTVHLGSVLTLLVVLPYGKFVHGVYRTAALIADASERGTEADAVLKH